MRVLLEYDSVSNIATIRHEEMDIKSEEDIQKWRQMVNDKLSKTIPKKDLPILLRQR